MSAMASQITSLTIIYSTVYSGADQRKHQRPASLVFVRGIHRWPVNSPHKGPVTRKMFSFDDVIVKNLGKDGLWLFRKGGVGCLLRVHRLNNIFFPYCVQYRVQFDRDISRVYSIHTLVIFRVCMYIYIYMCVCLCLCLTGIRWRGHLERLPRLGWSHGNDEQNSWWSQ